MIFVASRVDLKGCVPFEERDSLGLTKAEVMDYISRLKSKLTDEEVRRWIDMEATEALNSRVLHSMVSLKIKPVLNKSQRYYVRKKLLSLFVDGSEELKINGKFPRPVVELHPSRRPAQAIGGKALKKLEDHGLVDLKVEWPEPMKFYYAPQTGERPRLVAVHAKGVWTLKRDELKQIRADIDVDKLLQDLIS